MCTLLLTFVLVNARRFFFLLPSPIYIYIYCTQLNDDDNKKKYKASKRLTESKNKLLWYDSTFQICIRSTNPTRNVTSWMILISSKSQP